MRVGRRKGEGGGVALDPIEGGIDEEGNGGDDVEKCHLKEVLVVPAHKVAKPILRVHIAKTAHIYHLQIA